MKWEKAHSILYLPLRVLPLGHTNPGKDERWLLYKLQPELCCIPSVHEIKDTAVVEQLHMSSFLSSYIETITFLDHLLDLMSVGVCISVAVDKTCGNSITEYYYRVNKATCNTVSHLQC